MSLVHVHLILNHIPPIASVFGLAFLIAAMVRRSGELRAASFVVFVVSGLIAIPTYLTGDPAADAVQGLPGVDPEIVGRHDDAAGVALTGALVLGAVGLAGLVLPRTRLGARTEKPTVYASLVLALIVCGLMTWTANLGGQIRHSEIRPGASSAPTSASHEHD